MVAAVAESVYSSNEVQAVSRDVSRRTNATEDTRIDILPFWHAGQPLFMSEVCNDHDSDCINVYTVRLSVAPPDVVLSVTQ